MTKLSLHPGVCGFTALISADSEDGMEVTVRVESGCPAVQGMMEALGSEFDAFEVCMSKPGTNPFYEYAGEHFPAHGGCPVCAAIAKCVEAECGLALKKDVRMEFLED